MVQHDLIFYPLNVYFTFQFKATGATQPMGKINLSKHNLISLGKYIVATDVKCYHTIFFSK